VNVPTDLTLLYVYGSLKRDLANHHALAGAQFVGGCRTAPLYRLFDLGSYPALSAGGKRPIVGELYLVSATLLARLDAFEGDEYFRSAVSLWDGRRAEAYFMSDSARSAARELSADRWPVF
jgi:gamma-glutamylcyclotransferase (GGCT)/AIG2-like uncharacterized protein YtfP